MSPIAPLVRNLRFEIEETVPQYWHGGRKSLSIFLDNLSVFFPAGERFFVKSVRAHQAIVKGDKLTQDVRTFCGQEGVHGREHERYNEMLRRHGYPIESMEKRVEATLARVSRRLGDTHQLAVTCALEHFTALLGSMILTDPRLFEGAHPAMDALWRWHAAEENEHKNVAFDVYKAAGGGYVMRAYTMIGATVIFWAKVIEQQARMMHAAGILSSAEEWKALVRFLFVEPGGMARSLACRVRSVSRLCAIGDRGAHGPPFPRPG
jgi:predicted metal-dependent hydrolase